MAETAPRLRPIGRRDLLVLGGLLGTAGLAIVASRRLAPLGPDAGNTPIVRAILADTEAPVGGNPAGDVTFAVWTDFNCGACRRAHSAMMAAVEADGMTRLSFRDWPIFGDDSRGAARVTIAAALQGLYPRVHGTLMRGGRADAAAAVAAVGALGGDTDRLAADLDRHALRIDSMLARHAGEAFGLGLGGTPGHLVQRILLKGARPERDFRRAIRQARDGG
jgi:protein-disulfide isomerase